MLIIEWVIGLILAHLLGKFGLISVKLNGLFAILFLIFVPWGLGAALFMLLGVRK